MKLYYFIISIILFGKIITAQTFDDPMKFFPANAGDMWEYLLSDPPSYFDTVQTLSLKDSIDEDNTKYLWQTTFAINPHVLFDNIQYWIDSSFNVYTYFLDTIAIVYKLSAYGGEQWVTKRYNPSGFELVRVDTVYNTTIFGSPTILKKFRYYFSDDSLAATGMDRNAIYLAYGFGAVRILGLEGTGILNLKGSVINSVLYGDTTQIITSIFNNELNDYLEDFNIYQNFPNPFNSLTNIRFEINKTSEITIGVFDVLGVKIKDLINSETYYPGMYNIQWDGTDDNSNAVSSGIYFYHFNNKENKILNKMILLK